MAEDAANNGKRRVIREHGAGKSISEHVHGASGAALGNTGFMGIFVNDLAKVVVIRKTGIGCFHPHKYPRFC